jgi:flavin reductase (DIM6/NTAB) family NADH-FMN oxidoreductase RutF
MVHAEGEVGRDDVTSDDDAPVILPNGGEELWMQVFTVAPLVLVGTVEPDGAPDLAPKHQAMPLGWGDTFGFVCTSRHRTHANAKRTGAFTVSYPSPDQVVAIGQAAAPRYDGDKPSLIVVPQIPAEAVDGVLVAGASLWLECTLDRIIEGFGEHDLVVGKVVRAAAPRWAVRDPDVDDADLVHAHPALVYLCPDRFAAVSTTSSFPFPLDFRR